MNEVKTALEDLDDASVDTVRMRQALMKTSVGRKDILIVSMALRAARLQHASSPTLGNGYTFSNLVPGFSAASAAASSSSSSRAIPLHLKHRLAVDSLQLWAPLSFQMGLGYSIPELEVEANYLINIRIVFGHIFFFSPKYHAAFFLG